MTEQREAFFDSDATATDARELLFARANALGHFRAFVQTAKDDLL